MPVWCVVFLQWLFILEGAPAVLLGIFMLFALPSRPLNGNAWMLSLKEQQLLELEVRREGQHGWDTGSWVGTH
jgi:hypothetical protein